MPVVLEGPIKERSRTIQRKLTPFREELFLMNSPWVVFLWWAHTEIKHIIHKMEKKVLKELQTKFKSVQAEFQSEKN